MLSGGSMVVHLYWIWFVWEERRRQVGAWEISGAHEAVWIHQIFSGKFERLVFHYEVNYLKPLSASMVEAQPPVRKEDIIIVGAGIAGLATAVSLHRFGQQSPLIHQNLTRVPGVNLISFCPHSFCNSDYFLYKSCFSYMLSILKIIIKWCINLI